MILNIIFPYQISFKTHIIIGVILGIILSFILIFLQPFQTYNFEHPYKNLLLTGYGVMLCINYLTSHIIENLFYYRFKKWTLGNEIVFHLFSSFSAILFGSLYHMFIINKQSFHISTFFEFLFYAALPVLPLLVFPNILLRYTLLKDQDNSQLIPLSLANKNKIGNSLIELKGLNKKDVFTINKKKLLFVKSIDNYVEIYYLQDASLKKNVLRAPLSMISKQADFLIQPHRSYLINPDQSFLLTGNSQKSVLKLTDLKITIPVARSAYNKVKKITVHKKN